MDETLIHRVEANDKCQEAEVYVDVLREDGSGSVEVSFSSSQLSLPSLQIGFNIRPFAIDCLKEANKHFEVIVFTAGTKNYADSILNILDPTGELIQHRLYRDSCIEVCTDVGTVYVKDLRILEGRRLEDMVIVDNAVISFAYQINNGIPILPFREDKEDTEFLHLIKHMEDISKEPDCRNFVKRAFQLSEILSTDTDSYAHLYDCSESDEESNEDDELDLFMKCQESMNMLQKRKSDVKRKTKKIKNRRKTRQSFNMKKVKSVCVDNHGSIEAQFGDKNINSEKRISPFDRPNPFVSNPAYESDKLSQCIRLEESQACLYTYS